MTKKQKILFYSSTGLLTAFVLMGVSNYVFKTDMVAGMFGALGFPAYIIYPMAIAKILGLIAIWSKKFSKLKEWAYAGFFFNFTLAIIAHVAVADGHSTGAVIALLLLLISYKYKKRS